MRVPEHRSGGRGELVAIDLPPGEAWVEIVADLWWRGVPFLPLDTRTTAAERRVAIDRAQPTCVLDALGETAYAGARIDPSIAVVAATSGTGGAPRLVELGRRAVEAAVGASAAALDAEPGVPWIACLTPAHVGGLLVLLRAAVLGAPVVVHERFDPGAIVDAARDGGAFVSLVPAMLRRLVATGGSLEGLVALVGGGGLDARVAAEARDLGARVVTTYGLTETCGGVVYDGWPIGGTDVRVDEGGGVELRGPTLMERYRADPAATGAAFTPDGWLRTGDLGSIEDDGRLEVHGRADDLIRTGGEKVWPHEVERVLAVHPKVGDVAVAGAPHEDWGQQVVAYVVPATIDDPPELEELRDWVGDRIARFKAPRELVLVPRIDRTAIGKVRRPIR